MLKKLTGAFLLGDLEESRRKFHFWTAFKPIFRENTVSKCFFLLLSECGKKMESPIEWIINLLFLSIHQHIFVSQRTRQKTHPIYLIIQTQWARTPSNFARCFGNFFLWLHQTVPMANNIFDHPSDLLKTVTEFSEIKKSASKLPHKCEFKLIHFSE